MQKTDKQIKVACLFPGSTTDQSWNYVGYQGLMTLKSKFGVTVDYSESIEQADYESTFRKYAKTGYDLIIGHGSEFGAASITVAKEFPNQYFAVTNSDVCGPNLAGLDTRNGEMGYVAGYLAGLLSKNKIVAFLGATQIIAMKRAEQGFLIGVKEACPDCQILAEYIGSFDDETMGRNTALALIDRGVDVLFNNDDAAGLGALRVAEEKGIVAIGSDYDQKPVAPKAVVTSVLAYVTPMFVSIVQEVINGKFVPDNIRMNGFKTGVYKMAPFDTNLITRSQADIIYRVVEKLMAESIYLPHHISSLD